MHAKDTIVSKNISVDRTEARGGKNNERQQTQQSRTICLVFCYPMKKGTYFFVVRNSKV